MSDFELSHHCSENDVQAYRQLVDQLRSSPIPDNEILANLGLFLTRSSLARILFFHDLYRELLDTHGIIVELGVRWGQNLALLSALRAIYEPFNTSRKLVGFDTFSGFPATRPEDGESGKATPGAYDVSENYEAVLEEILLLNEQLNPKNNERKFELVKGDVLDTVPDYLEKHPETLVSMIYFDLDLYEPTRAALQAFLPYCARNTIFAFDELCYPDFPGETIALREVFAGRDFTVTRSPVSPQQSIVRLC